MGNLITNGQLPPAFRALEPYLEWSLPTERQRSAKRQASTMVEITGFYEAMLPRLEEILALLAQYSPVAVPADVQRLSNLALTLAEIAPAVENFGQPSVVDGYDVSRLIALHE